MTEDQIELYRKASGEIWSLFKAYADTQNTDDKQWQELFDYSNKICNKYKGTTAENYTRNYISGVIIPEIERLSKAGR